MITNRIITPFLLAASIGLSGCATSSYNVNKNSCTGWDENDLKVPLMIEFGSKSKASIDTACIAGKNIGYAAILGRQPDGSLRPASLIIWHKEYQELVNKIASLPPELQPQSELAKIKIFADFFIQDVSKSYGGTVVTSAMAKSMYETKVTDPTLFTQDGKFAPPTKEEICKGKMFRVCKPVQTEQPPTAEQPSPE